MKTQFEITEKFFMIIDIPGYTITYYQDMIQFGIGSLLVNTIRSSSAKRDGFSSTLPGYVGKPCLHKHATTSAGPQIEQEHPDKYANEEGRLRPG